VLGWIDVTGTQVTDQQLFTAKNVKWQEAIIVVIAVESTPHLLTVHPIIGAIKIQN
jgi:hypothetical protein